VTLHETESVTGAPYKILKLQSVPQLNTVAKSMITGIVPSSGRSGTAAVGHV